jgi:hypothetical protein
MGGSVGLPITGLDVDGDSEESTRSSAGGMSESLTILGSRKFVPAAPTERRESDVSPNYGGTHAGAPAVSAKVVYFTTPPGSSHTRSSRIIDHSVGGAGSSIDSPTPVGRTNPSRSAAAPRVPPPASRSSSAGVAGITPIGGGKSLSSPVPISPSSKANGKRTPSAVRSPSVGVATEEFKDGDSESEEGGADGSAHIAAESSGSKPSLASRFIGGFFGGTSFGARDAEGSTSASNGKSTGATATQGAAPPRFSLSAMGKAVWGFAERLGMGTKVSADPPAATIDTSDGGVREVMRNEGVLQKFGNEFGEVYIASILRIFDTQIFEAVKSSKREHFVGEFETSLREHATGVCVEFLVQEANVVDHLAKGICSRKESLDWEKQVLASYIYDSFNGMWSLNILTVRLFAIDAGFVDLSAARPVGSAAMWQSFIGEKGVVTSTDPMDVSLGESVKDLRKPENFCVSVLLNFRVNYDLAVKKCGKKEGGNEKLKKYLKDVYGDTGVLLDAKEIAKYFKEGEYLPLHGVSPGDSLITSKQLDRLPLLGLWPAVEVLRPVVFLQERIGPAYIGGYFKKVISQTESLLVDEWVKLREKKREEKIARLSKLFANLYKEACIGMLKDSGVGSERAAPVCITEDKSPAQNYINQILNGSAPLNEGRLLRLVNRVTVPASPVSGAIAAPSGIWAEIKSHYKSADDYAEGVEKAVSETAGRSTLEISLITVFGEEIKQDILNELDDLSTVEITDAATTQVTATVIQKYTSDVCVGFLETEADVSDGVAGRICGNSGKKNWAENALYSYLMDSFNEVRPLNVLAVKLFAIENRMVVVGEVNNEKWKAFKSKIPLIVSLDDGITPQNNPCLGMLLSVGKTRQLAENFCFGSSGSGKNPFIDYMETVLRDLAKFDPRDLAVVKCPEDWGHSFGSIPATTIDQVLIAEWSAVLVTQPLMVLRRAIQQPVGPGFVEILARIDSLVVDEWAKLIEKTRAEMVTAIGTFFSAQYITVCREMLMDLIKLTEETRESVCNGTDRSGSAQIYVDSVLNGATKFGVKELSLSVGGNARAKREISTRNGAQLWNKFKENWMEFVYPATAAIEESDASSLMVERDAPISDTNLRQRGGLASLDHLDIGSASGRSTESSDQESDWGTLLSDLSDAEEPAGDAKLSGRESNVNPEPGAPFAAARIRRMPPRQTGMGLFSDNSSTVPARGGSTDSGDRGSGFGLGSLNSSENGDSPPFRRRSSSDMDSDSLGGSHAPSSDEEARNRRCIDGFLSNIGTWGRGQIKIGFINKYNLRDDKTLISKCPKIAAMAKYVEELFFSECKEWVGRNVPPEDKAKKARKTTKTAKPAGSGICAFSENPKDIFGNRSEAFKFLNSEDDSSEW